MCAIWSAASSSGHRDRLIVDVLGGGPVEDSAGCRVDAVLDAAQIGGGEAGEVGAFPDVPADEAVAVLVGGSLPWRVGVCEVDADAAALGEGGVAGHLAASVPGERSTQRCWDPPEQTGQRDGVMGAVRPSGSAAIHRCRLLRSNTVMIAARFEPMM